MTAIKTNVPAQQRAPAEEARRKAEDEADKATRKALLNDAALWERMADYEEKHPQSNSIPNPNSTLTPRKSTLNRSDRVPEPRRDMPR